MSYNKFKQDRDILGKGKNNIEDYDISDFVIENYRHHSNISAPMIA